MPHAFASLDIENARVEPAPDGSAVTVLLRLERGALTRFALEAGATSRAVVHRTVEEIWLFASGTGALWRKQDAREEVLPVGPGLCVTLPVGTSFQLRADAEAPLVVVAATMPPWPGETEAIFVEGPWLPTARR
jgi:mannose-6-phosphate isomerase-like protein (cupin superfamily)